MANDPLIDRRAFTWFILVCGVLLSAFLFMWVITDDAKIAAAIVVSSGLTVTLILVGVGIGRHANRPDTPAPTIIEQPHQVTPALPEPRWFQMSDHTFTRSDALDAKAAQIGQLLRDRRLQPTRSNIKAVGMEIGVNGNEAASMIYRRFVSWDWAVQVSQGEPGRWKEDE